MKKKKKRSAYGAKGKINAAGQNKIIEVDQNTSVKLKKKKKKGKKVNKIKLIVKLLKNQNRQKLRRTSVIQLDFFLVYIYIYNMYSFSLYCHCPPCLISVVEIAAGNKSLTYYYKFLVKTGTTPCSARKLIFQNFRMFSVSCVKKTYVG